MKMRSDEDFFFLAFLHLRSTSEILFQCVIRYFSSLFQLFQPSIAQLLGDFPFLFFMFFSYRKAFSLLFSLYVI